jgi:glycosyltransferase involved in cell wall biosynthesis
MFKQKILIAPLEIAGYYSNLTKGFRQIGVECDFITFEPHPFGYGGETRRPLMLQLSDEYKIKGRNVNNWIYRFYLLVISSIVRNFWAISACFKYDVFIFSYGSSLINNNFDLLLLRLLKKKVISNLAHGSEARPAFLDGSYQSFNGQLPSISHLRKLNKNIYKKVSFHFKFSNVVIGAPFSTSYFAESKFINLFSLGLPFNNSNFQILDPPKSTLIKDQIRILHSPSHPAVKGTNKILKVIERLQQKGYTIDFITIQGKSFQEVINEIQLCDFVVDQLYSDTPMAGFATEAAWFGKPAVVGGYGLEALKEFIPTSMWPPSYICLPNEIESAIEAMITNKEMRDELGSAAQAFVKSKWNFTEVASKFLRIIDNDIPDSWWINPKSIEYFYGGGQSAKITKKNIRDLVSKYGKSSLQLTDKPDLEDRLISFSKEVN